MKKLDPTFHQHEDWTFSSAVSLPLRCVTFQSAALNHGTCIQGGLHRRRWLMIDRQQQRQSVMWHFLSGRKRFWGTTGSSVDSDSICSFTECTSSPRVTRHRGAASDTWTRRSEWHLNAACRVKLVCGSGEVSVSGDICSCAAEELIVFPVSYFIFSSVIELICGRIKLEAASSQFTCFSFQKKMCPFGAFAPAVWVYSSHGFNTVSELHAMSSSPIGWSWLHCSETPHIENLKSSPCGGFYFNPGSPASPSSLCPDGGFWLLLVFGGPSRPCNYGGFWCRTGSRAGA